MSNPEELVTARRRAFPVILLADVSGSMEAEGKIAALNQAVREMLATFARTDDVPAEIQVAVITFGEVARVHAPLAPAAGIRWTDAVAQGSTPMGHAMELAADLVEDRELIPARSYRPTVVLVSDGQPTDSWETGLARLTKQGRAQRAQRLALAIGGDADEAMLKRFLADPEQPLFRAEDARRVRDFFRFVTMSVTARASGTAVGQLPPMMNPMKLDRF